MRYVRNTPLKFEGKILLIGLGGVGSSIAYNLAGLGLNFDVVDNDHVEESNLNRQWLYSSEDLGKRKVDCALNSLNKFNPDLRIRGYYSIDEIDFKDYSLVIDATDNVETRVKISKLTKQFSIPLIYASAEEFRFTVGRFSAKYPHEIFLGNTNLDQKLIFPPAATIAGALAVDLVFKEEGDQLYVGELGKNLYLKRVI